MQNSQRLSRLASPRRKSKMKKPTTHGGARKGAGRKLGSGKGRTVISKTIAMTATSWDKLDAVRGKISRGKFIGALI
jgi:hypothetical protein